MAAEQWLPPALFPADEKKKNVDRPTVIDDSIKKRLALAKELYRKAGYSKDRPLQTTLHYNTSEQNKRIAVAIAAMWKQHLGVKVELINEEWKVFLNRRKGKTDTQLYRASWIADYDDASSFLELFTSNHAKNDTGYANQHYDKLVEQIASTIDNAQRDSLIRQAEQKLLDDQVVIPVYHYVSRHLVKSNIKGYQANPLDHHYSRYLYKE